jgi:hypothetical protein
LACPLQVWLPNCSQTPIAYLVKIGFDPKSPMITQIIGDKVGNITLDSLAGDHDRSEVRRFIITRNFVRQYKVNPDLPWPSALDYNDRYFTDEEVDFFSARDAERLKRRCAAEKIPSGKLPALPVANRRSSWCLPKLKAASISLCSRSRSPQPAA